MRKYIVLKPDRRADRWLLLKDQNLGHTRLGTLPKTRKWDAVVAMLASPGGDGGMSGDPGQSDFSYEVARVAEKAMDAASRAFDRASRDPGLADAFFLLIRVSLACRTSEPVEALRDIGLRLATVPTRAEVVRELTRALDDASSAPAHRSDYTEMGRASIAEAVAGWLRQKDAQGSLFGSPEGKIWSDLRGIATQEGFADVTHRALGGLTSRILGFYLSRAVEPLAGDGLIGGVSDLTNFEEELRRHSLERSRIAREFAGTWFAKHEFREGGIDRGKAKRFVAYALQKVASELGGKPSRK